MHEVTPRVPRPMTQVSENWIDWLEHAEARQVTAGVPVARDDSNDFSALAFIIPTPNRAATDAGRVVAIDDVEPFAVLVDRCRNHSLKVAQLRKSQYRFDGTRKASPPDASADAGAAVDPNQ